MAEQLTIRELCRECGKKLKGEAALYKVQRNEDGKIVIEDPGVLELYELDGVEIDPGTGTPLLPGKRSECFGNGEHEGFSCCCDECSHYLTCYPEWDFGGSAWKGDHPTLGE